MRTTESPVSISQSSAIALHLRILPKTNVLQNRTSKTTYLVQTASRSASSPCAPRHCRPRLLRQPCKSSLPPRRAPGCNGCRMPNQIKPIPVSTCITLQNPFLVPVPSFEPIQKHPSHGCRYTHVKSPLQLAVSSQFDKHHLVQRQADQVERFVDRVGAGAGFFGRCHSASFVVGVVCVCMCVVVAARRCDANAGFRRRTSSETTFHSLSDVGAYSRLDLDLRTAPVPLLPEASQGKQGSGIRQPRANV